MLSAWQPKRGHSRCVECRAVTQPGSNQEQEEKGLDHRSTKIAALQSPFRLPGAVELSSRESAGSDHLNSLSLAGCRLRLNAGCLIGVLSCNQYSPEATE